MKDATGKGSFSLGTACGRCSKCIEYLNKTRQEVQQTLMKYDPVTGEDAPYPSHAQQYRDYHGKLAWLYNPWVGVKRDARDIGSDVEGFGIVVE